MKLMDDVRALVPAAVVALMTALAPVASAQAPASEPAISDKPVADDRYPERRITFPGGVTGLPDVTYAARPGFRPLALDLYLPPDSASNQKSPPNAGFPLIVHIHGGGWSAGHARHAAAFADFPAVLASIAARGYVVASVNYRLAGEAPSPAQVMDIKTAVRWLRAKAGAYRIDPARVALWGESAGGHLAALTAATCGVDAYDPVTLPPPGSVDPEGRPLTSTLPPEVAGQTDCVQCAVAWYGLFDFTTVPQETDKRDHPVMTASAAYLGCELDRCQPGLAEGASPVTYVDADTPPMLLIHGTADELHSPKQSEAMAAELKKAGVSTELALLDGVGHSLIGRTPDDTRAASLKALDSTLRFFDRTLRKESRAQAGQ